MCKPMSTRGLAIYRLQGGGKWALGPSCTGSGPTPSYPGEALSFFLAIGQLNALAVDHLHRLLEIVVKLSKFSYARGLGSINSRHDP